jgi:hypothetical protein
MGFQPNTLLCIFWHIACNTCWRSETSGTGHSLAADRFSGVTVFCWDVPLTPGEADREMN